LGPPENGAGNLQRYFFDAEIEYLVGGLEHFFIFPNSWDDDPI